MTGERIRPGASIDLTLVHIVVNVQNDFARRVSLSFFIFPRLSSYGPDFFCLSFTPEPDSLSRAASVAVRGVLSIITSSWYMSIPG